MALSASLQVGRGPRMRRKAARPPAARAWAPTPRCPAPRLLRTAREPPDSPPRVGAEARLQYPMSVAVRAQRTAAQLMVDQVAHIDEECRIQDDR